MSSYFPRKTIAWHLEEPPFLRRLSLWIVPMALLTGVVVRSVRAGLLVNLDTSWAALGFYYGLTGTLYLSALTAHLANYTTRQWLWRVPVFAAVEAAAEAAMSAGFIALGREPMGTARATWSDWSSLAWGGFWYRLILAVVFGAVLAVIITVVQRALLRREVVEAMESEADAETGELRRKSIEMASPLGKVLKQ